MTGMTRTRRMRKNQVEYKRAEGLGLYLEGNYYLLKLKANAKQGTSRLSISCHYRKNLTVTTVRDNAPNAHGFLSNSNFHPM